MNIAFKIVDRDTVLNWFGSEMMFPAGTKLVLSTDKKEEAEQWRGPEDGLPPVGTECEMVHPGISSYGWQRVEIKAYFDNRVAVKSNPDIWHDSAGYATINIDDELKFRPIRTEEEKSVEEMYRDAQKSDCVNFTKGMAAALYHAGYRKQEAE